MSDIPVNPVRGTATGALPTSAFSTAQHHHHLGFPSASDDDVLAALAAVARAPDDGHDKDPDEHEIRAVLGQQQTSFDRPATTQQQQQQAQQPRQPAVSKAKRTRTASDGSEGQDGEGSGKAKEGRVWTCRTCGRQFARRFNCTTHERTHLDIRDVRPSRPLCSRKHR